METLRERRTFAPEYSHREWSSRGDRALLGIDPSRISNGLVVLLASLLELASGFGVFVATSAFSTDAKVRPSHKTARMVPSRPATNSREHSGRSASANIASLSTNRDTTTINDRFPAIAHDLL
jgi:hypothetical protein